MKQLFIIGVAVTLLLCGCQQKAKEPVPSASIHENAATVMGRVSYVSGNDFTLAVGEYSGGTSQGTAPRGRGERSAEREQGADGAEREQGADGAADTQRFVENGEELSFRVPVGTNILYGSLNVDFSQIQTDYIVSVVYRLTDSGNSVSVLSAEILST